MIAHIILSLQPQSHLQHGDAVLNTHLLQDTNLLSVGPGLPANLSHPYLTPQSKEIAILKTSGSAAACPSSHLQHGDAVVRDVQYAQAGQAGQALDAGQAVVLQVCAGQQYASRRVVSCCGLPSTRRIGGGAGQQRIKAGDMGDPVLVKQQPLSA